MQISINQLLTENNECAEIESKLLKKFGEIKCNMLPDGYYAVMVYKGREGAGSVRATKHSAMKETLEYVKSLKWMK